MTAIVTLRAATLLIKMGELGSSARSYAMNPRLLVISGPLAGTVLLVEERVSVGRGSDCSLRIKHGSVSRLHCLIERDEDNFTLKDHSSYGTFVNHTPVKEHLLKHGDQIRVGENLLLFLLSEPDTSFESHGVQLDNGDLVTRSAFRLQEEISFFHEGKLRAELVSPTRTLRDLQVLLKFSTSINSFRSLDALQQEVLKLLLEIVPASRGAIILLREGLEDFASAFSLDRTTARPDQPLLVSRTVAQQVINEGVPLLSNDIAGSDKYQETESLIISNTRSLLCIPIKDGERASGLIYLTSGHAEEPFDERHLELGAAVAGICSAVIQRVRYIEWLEGERRRLHEELNLQHAMIGESRKMREVFQVIAKAAPTDSSVLICGESGTGKELVAQAVHLNSRRSEKPFIAVNCAALTETLIESELFGHEKGAFTGAFTQKKGKIEVADGGTLFLDEIGELSPSLQAKLLRVLQERTFERVGGTRSLKVDIRLIAATNRNMQDAIADRSFRPDLYYRLNVINIQMPPLRERPEDIPLLARYFAAKYGGKCKRRIEGLSPAACACLVSYNWPGNVRELENAIERAVVLGASELITPEDLPETVRSNKTPANPAESGFYEILKNTKKQLILNAFEQASRNHIEAAKLLGIHPNNLYRLMRSMNLKIE